jgi:phage terminase Nu1 subunit (DNA packaging protein)
VIRDQKDRGELLAAAGVQAEWSSILSAVRAGMLAVASRVAARLPHLTRADVGEIDQEIRQVLTAVGTGQQP